MNVYLDNAAASRPKTKSEFKKTTDFFHRCGGTPERTGPDRVTFSRNAAEVINTILFGFLDCGDHLIPANVEHTAELNSPLPRKMLVKKRTCICQSKRDRLR
jgi:selenocysteine lyase/cysteine desulfurase